MGGRHKIFEDPITWTQDIRKTKFICQVFSESPFISFKVTKLYVEEIKLNISLVVFHYLAQIMIISLDV